MKASRRSRRASSPSPAMLAFDTFDPEAVRQDLLATRKICEENNCPLELILKDIEDRKKIRPEVVRK